MSLTLAKTWVNSVVRLPATRDDALHLLDQADREGVEATLILGPRLTVSGKCFLSRWDGRELIVRELTRAQQRDWSLDPKGLFQQLKATTLPKAGFFSEPLAALTISQIDGAGAYDGSTPLLGRCIVERTAISPRVIQNCALRAEYFRPDLSRQVTAMWYADRDLHGEQATWEFRFPPLFSNKNPRTCRGTLAVFFQLFTADDWANQAGCRRISNLADSIITLR
jgi:hypothetical protein